MENGQFVNLNGKNIKFHIVNLSKNKYALVISENAAVNIFDIFKEYDDAKSAYLDIINDYSYGMSELFCRKGRWKHECMKM